MQNNFTKIMSPYIHQVKPHSLKPRVLCPFYCGNRKDTKPVALLDTKANPRNFNKSK